MLELSKDTTRRALLVLVWPITQLVFLRLYLHYFLGLRFGFVNTTDFDFLLPAPIAFIALMHALKEGEGQAGVGSELKFQPLVLVVNLVSMAAFLLLNQGYEQFSLLSPLATVLAWVTFLSLILVSAFCVGIDPRFYVKNPNRFAFLPCVLIATSLYFYTYGFHEGWNWLGPVTSQLIYEFFHQIPFAHVTSSFRPEVGLVISHPLFEVGVGKPCAGFDSLFFFSLIFLLATTLYGRAVSFWRWSAAYLGGLLLMFTLNLFRIVALFFLGIALREVMPHKLALNIFKLLFHAHTGWLLYSAGIVLYLRALKSALVGSFQTKRHLQLERSAL
jgi:exosortase/archaeosortase family protein